MKRTHKAQMTLRVTRAENGFIVESAVPSDDELYREGPSWTHVGTSRARTKKIILDRAEELAEEILNRAEAKE